MFKCASRCIYFDSLKEKNDEIRYAQRYSSQKGTLKEKRLLWFLLIPLLIIALGAGGYSFHIYSKAKSILSNAYSELGRGDKSSKREKAVKPMTDNISVLIMGVDESDIRDKNYGKATRTDALLLATINKTINLLSLSVFHVIHVSILNHVINTIKLHTRTYSVV